MAAVNKASPAAKKAPSPKAPTAPTRRRVVDDEDAPKATTSVVTDPAPKAPEPASEPKTKPVVGDGIVDTPEEALKAAKERVIARVPRTFRLRLSSHSVITYPEGAYAMDKEHALHWYSKANGVTIVEG